MTVGDAFLTCDVFCLVNETVHVQCSCFVHSLQSTHHTGALSSPPSAQFSAFLDWSKSKTGIRDKEIWRYKDFKQMDCKLFYMKSVSWKNIFLRIQFFESNSLLLLFVYCLWEMFILHLWLLQVPCWIWSVLLSSWQSSQVLLCRPSTWPGVN